MVSNREESLAQFCSVCILMICILLLAKSEVGCFIGNWFIGALAYADDIVLLAPGASAKCAMLHSCDTHFAEQYNVIFNVSKSKCMFFPSKGCHSRRVHCKPAFYINGGSVEYVEEWLHLGHVISSNLNDKSEIFRGRAAH